MEKVKSLTLNARDIILQGFVIFVLLWVSLALLIQVTALILHFSGNDELLNNWSTNLEHRIDGRFKNNPNNIMYNQDNTIWVDGVVNNVKIGKLP